MKSICEPSDKLHEFIIALEKSGFKLEDIKKIINAKNNKLARVMNMAYLIELRQAELDKRNKRHYLSSTFQFTVPDNYDHEHQLALFLKESRAKNKFYDFNDYNNNITDANFAKVTNKLIPGKTYTANIFQVNESMSPEDNLSFLKSQSAILVGAQGLSLVEQLKANELPVDRRIFSFDEYDALFGDVFYGHMVPYIIRSSDNYLIFDYKPFRESLGGVERFLCVCDLPLKA